MRTVVVLGSTGSVGTQALEVVRQNRDEFRVIGLAAGGSNIELLAAQAVEFGVDVVGIAHSDSADELRSSLAVATTQQEAVPSAKAPEVLIGPTAASEIAAVPCDVVLNAMTGSIGLAPTLAALAAGSTLALANKESLIVGGPLVKAAASPGQIVPVDSEHSALAQCLRAGRADEVRRLVLTASGGPFRGRTRESLGSVSPAEALAHPTWDMGPVVTINSATLVNKGLEVIEAHHLFDVPFDHIEVVVHPQSVVHSMVEFHDGSTIAQASPPDMRLPIACALGWPDRLADAAPGCDWSTSARWDFLPLDEAAFPAVALARSAGSAGHTAPAVYNAVNEECVAAFLSGEWPFLGIVDTIRSVLSEHLSGDHSGSPAGAGVEKALTIDDVLDAEAWARSRAQQVLKGNA